MPHSSVGWPQNTVRYVGWNETDCLDCDLFDWRLELDRCADDLMNSVKKKGKNRNCVRSLRKLPTPPNNIHLPLLCFAIHYYHSKLIFDRYLKSKAVIRNAYQLIKTSSFNSARLSGRRRHYQNPIWTCRSASRTHLRSPRRVYENLNKFYLLRKH